MNGGFNTAGFTIIETLIVLGVTAALLFSVLLLIGGKTDTNACIVGGLVGAA